MLKEFSYNPDEINDFSMSRLIGLGLTLLKKNEFEDETLHREFLVKSFNQENIKIKDNAEAKTKSEEKKKELPPLPNIKIKDCAESKTNREEKENEVNQVNKIL